MTSIFTSQVTPTVFIVDDDLSARESLECLICLEGWRAVTFGLAEEFLADPRVFVSNCLVLDIALPDLSGLDLQKRMTVERRDMPIIFITGFGDVPMKVRAMKAGTQEVFDQAFQG